MNLKNCRKKLGLTQQEVANKLEISQTNYSRYELGLINPDANMLIKLADFFHVSLDYLVGRKYNDVDFSTFTDSHNDLLKKIANLNEAQCEKLSSYIDGITTK